MGMCTSDRRSSRLPSSIPSRWLGIDASIAVPMRPRSSVWDVLVRISRVSQLNSFDKTEINEMNHVGTFTNRSNPHDEVSTT